jgi:hypothetical protein
MRRPGVSGNPKPDPSTVPKTNPSGSDPPDIGVELNLTAAGGCLPKSTQDQLRDAIRSAFETAFPHVDVRVACIHERERVGIWTTRAANADIEAARNASLATLDLLVPSDPVIPAGLGVLVTQDFIGRMAHQAWVALPKRYRLRDDGSTVPDPHGTVYLQEFGYDLKKPDTITVGISGSASKPNSWVSWVDEHFTMSIIDRLVVSNGRLLAHTHTTKPDTSVDFWEKLFAGIEAFEFPWVIPELFTSTGSPGTPQSIGGAIAALMPSEILVPGGDQRVVFSYKRVAVSSKGVTAGGSMTLEKRKPWVKLVKDEFTADPGESTAHVPLQLVTHDLRAPLTVHWGNSVSHKLFETAEFSIAGKVGDIVSRPLQIEIVDADGVKAKLHAAIKFRLVMPPHSSPKNNPKGPAPEPKKVPNTSSSAKARKPRAAVR